MESLGTAFEFSGPHTGHTFSFWIEWLVF